MFRCLFITWLMLLLCSSNTTAQLRIPLLNKLDSMLEVRQKTPKTDTNYVVRPDSRWTLRLINNLSGTNFTLKLTMFDDSKANVRFWDPLRHTVTLSANYRGLAVAFAVNPEHLFGRKTSTEFNINSYSNRYGFDFIYEKNGSFEGTVRWGDIYEHLNDEIEESSMTINGYYAFNGRKFSYPAAFSQSFIQKRSAGSLMLGASFHHGSVDIVNQDEEYYQEDNIRKIKLNYFSVGMGYGYNFVPHRQWLLHLSALPSLVLWRENKVVMMGHNEELPATFPEISLVGRASIVHYFKHFFAGLTLVYNYSSAGDYESIRIRHYKWRTRLILGKRF